MINVDNLFACYGGTEVLHGVSFTAAEGEITAVIGPNGCGKTTLLNCVARQMEISAGEVTIAGKSHREYSAKEFAQRLSFLIQSRDVAPISVYSLALHGRFPYMSFPRRVTKQDRDIARQALERVGIWELRDKSLQELSGGERQKAYIAMALSQNSDILLLDEPTTYLDIRHQLELIQLLSELKAEGKTIVTVLHDINMALRVCDKICLLDKGRLVFSGSPRNLARTDCVKAVFDVDTVFNEACNVFSCDFRLN